MTASEKRSENEGNLGGPVFSPPLYKQRYAAALDLIKRIHAKRVIDMGCAECTLLRKLCKEPSIQEVVGVDIDGTLLNERQHLIEPLITDYLYPRGTPLVAKLMQGSIAEPDARLCGFDLLICLEVIEHLEADVLKQVPHVVFGYLQPHCVLITTPNYEFNILFSGCSTRYRHYDHKFEWTRKEFQEWCKMICSRYQYTFETSGVGDPPGGCEHLGHCSQMATFMKCSAETTTSFAGVSMGEPYTLVAQSEHPSQSPQPLIERLASEAQYYLRILGHQKVKKMEEDGWMAADGGMVLVPLEDVLVYPRVRQLCPSIDKLREALVHSGAVKLDVFEINAMFPTDNWLSQSSSSSEYEERNQLCGSGDVQKLEHAPEHETDSEW